MIIKSPAKINLALQIQSIREDGYHYLRMVNLLLDLHDAIEIETHPLYHVTHVVCDEMRLMGLRSNLCTKAVDLLIKEFGFQNKFMIRIHKEIPFAAGLGGGSSNAAAVTMALNKMLKLKQSNEDLCRLTLPLGSDIPFFIMGTPALAEGIGDKLTPIKPKKSYFCLLVKPNQGLSTKDVYTIADNFPRQTIDIEKVIRGVEDGNEDMIIEGMGNDLYLPACSLCPEVETIVKTLREDGFALSGMSGSGSCCFALSMDVHRLKAEQKKMERAGYDVILTHTVK